MSLESRRKQEVHKRLDILEMLLNSSKGMYPPSCDCVIRSRDAANHHPHCPYRALKYAIKELRDSLFALPEDK